VGVQWLTPCLIRIRTHFIYYLWRYYISKDSRHIWCSWDSASWYITIVKPTRCTIFLVYWMSLYMFRRVFPSIIRSPKLYIQRQLYVIQVRWLHASGHPSMHSTNLYDIYLTLYVQSRTPDDGRKDRPKHVDWYSINSINCASSWYYYRNIPETLLPAKTQLSLLHI
jgi:hypothetical protein